MVFLELDDSHSAQFAALVVVGSAFLLEEVVDLVGSAFLTLLVVDHSPQFASAADVVESLARTAPTRVAVATAIVAVRIFFFFVRSADVGRDRDYNSCGEMYE